MKHAISIQARARRQFCLATTSSALALSLAAAAPAQIADTKVTGLRTLLSQQANNGAAVLANANDAQLNIVAGTIAGTAVTLSDNDIAAVARGNRATQDLAPDAQDLPTYGPSVLTAGKAGLTADAGTVVATRQSNAGSTVQADNPGPGLMVTTGAVSRSKTSLAGNTQAAIGLGNDAASTLALTGLTSDAGAGIVSFQTGDATSSVAARSYGRTLLATQGVSASDLAVTGNLERAIAYGNAVANGLSAKTGGVLVPAGTEIASIVPAPHDGDPEVAAAFAVLGNQVLGGTILARAGDPDGAPDFGVTVSGNLDGSSVKNDGNMLAAAGYGNQSANRLDLDSVFIGRAPAAGNDAGGAVANITGVQRLDAAARVTAMTQGRPATSIAGNVADASLSASGNSGQTIATGNRADGNLLAVKAGVIDAAGDGSSGGALGTALSTPGGRASTSAAFSVQNVQDYGHAAITATSSASDVQMATGGQVDRSVLTADKNMNSVAATGNSAASGARLDATSARTSVAVNNRQTGDGAVTVSLGVTDDRAGAVIAPVGAVTDSRLSVSDNALAGTATGNTAANNLTVNATVLRNDGSHGETRAGALADGYGVTGTFVLANEQKLGQPSIDGNATPAIASTVFGRFAVTGYHGADRSSFAVDDNLQQANSIGNIATNRLAVSTTGHDGALSPAAGSALSSSQYGQAKVSAASDMKVAAKGAVSASSVSLSGNGNEAVATINQANNALSVDGEHIGSATGTDTTMSTDPLGPPRATGDHLLANQQFAIGSVAASARTRLIDGDTGGGLTASRFSISNNTTNADAAANRVLNAVSIAATSGQIANAAMINTQVNAAGVTANATTDADYTVGGAPAYPAAKGSSVSIDGNVTTALARGNIADNQLALTGGSVAPLSAPKAAVSRYEAAIQAPAGLLNAQANYGAVTASTAGTRYGEMLNGPDASASGSSLGVTGNSASAAAYGNVANNAVTTTSLGGVSAAMANVQSNHGPVTAQVTGAGYRILSGAQSNGALSVTGNQLMAMAVGNQAISILAAQR